MKITFVLSVSISAVSCPLSQMSHACKYNHGEVLATLWHGHLYLTPDITITRNQDKKYLSPLIFFLNAAMKISRLTRLLTNNTLPPWQKTCWAIYQFLASYLLCLPRKKCIFFANSKLPSCQLDKNVLGKFFIVFCFCLPGKHCAGQCFC